MNQLGGVFVNGKPLPKIRRLQIIQLARLGVRASDISRELRISHGCVSKILNKFYETGSIEPGALPSPNAREITPEILKKIEKYTEEHPDVFSWEVRDRLLVDGICTKASLPSMDKISQLLKAKAGQRHSQEKTSRQAKLEPPYSDASVSESDDDSDECLEKEHLARERRFNGPFSISSLLKTEDGRKAEKNYSIDRQNKNHIG